MVDLSKAKAGDIVHFRCGGEAVIESIKKNFTKSYDIMFKNNGRRRSAWFYHADGTQFQPLFDIIEIKPAPEPLPDVFRYANAYPDGLDCRYVSIEKCDYWSHPTRLAVLKITFNPNTLEAKAEVVK